LRILLDECVPRQLKRSFPAPHVAMTAPEAGFAGLKNGQLLRAADGNFDVLVTTDKNLQYQQNLSQYSLAFILLRARTNDIVDLEPLIPKLLPELERISGGHLVVIDSL
jgi:predicted nuclease of predicted toxin-antitoxin system